MLWPRPPAEMLVGEEQHLRPPREGPLGDGAGVGRGAHDAAMFAAEGLQIGRRVDVGDRGDFFLGIQHFVQLAPAAFHLGQIGHVGHRAAGGEIGKNGDLLRRGHDVGDLGHEMHAAEDDVFRICLRGQLGQLQRIAGQIGVLVDIGPLVVVAEDYGLLAQLGAGDADAVRAILVREVVEGGKGDRGGLHAVLLNISLSFVRYWCRIRHGEHFLCRQCASYGGLMACAHCCASVGCPINFSIICNC